MANACLKLEKICFRIPRSVRISNQDVTCLKFVLFIFYFFSFATEAQNALLY